MPMNHSSKGLLVLCWVLLGFFANPALVNGKDKDYTWTKTKSGGSYGINEDGLKPVKCVIYPTGSCCDNPKSKNFKKCYPSVFECVNNCIN
uniref:Uncharacterized protein n=1 Tax=Oryza brachyantha TaxID=4533 RepID=J3KVZ4_ORYBR